MARFNRVKKVSSRNTLDCPRCGARISVNRETKSKSSPWTPAHQREVDRIQRNSLSHLP